MTDTTGLLRQLARAHGISTAYTTDRGHRVEVSPGTLVAVLAACGVDAATGAAARAALAAHRERTAARLLPDCVVARGGTAPRLALPTGGTAEVELEEGGTAPLSGPLPAGRHTVHVTVPGRTESAPLFAVPQRLPVPAGRHWGFLVQLYSVLSRRSWGMGDLGDLAELASWSGRALGADFVQLGPLHAVEPGPLPDPSPYRPSSRRYPDPMHVRVEAIPEYARLAGEARRTADRCAARARALNEGVLRGGLLIDRETVRRLKHEALRAVHQVPLPPGRAAAFAEFTAREGQDLTDFATWCALAGVHGGAWHSWPAGLRDPRSPDVARAREELAAEVAFHRWLAWVTDEQLAAAQAAATDAGMRIGLIHDLAVGVAPQGADTWALRDCLAAGMSVGAPPDDFNPHGQDWGQPPWRPDALAASGYRPLAGLLRAGLRHAGALRIDHVMGLFRLWWVPEGRPPSEGTYVRYDGEAMLGVLTLEAHRAGAAVIGEDLGTVEAAVRTSLDECGVLGTSVQRFEYLGGSEGRLGPLPPEQWRRDCLATLTTHDLPATAAWLSGEHVELRARLGLLTRPEEEEKAEAAAERDGWLAELERLGLLPDPDGDVVALHRFLCRTPARLLGVWLPDATGDRRPQNIPGTSTVHPNWRLPVSDGRGRPVPLEDLPGRPLVAALARVFEDLRRQGENT
ncbi:4-alpha-glucanotransferase [Streptomyces lucensis JCM 4490]|uniref:4-alpha-glucanotransferase n=1 Tax=Streptomyces lucensis JCM 4490 TaxID=1306176 RepID=A0A918MTK1_9ACTN|nr:4-alpha-glucanotransferase [Streptomyces lucensis]GGW63331.1 4-alpha-glucanotransferase [Streptomyces lucensis JCM 4490]